MLMTITLSEYNQIASEWHPTKNGTMQFGDLKTGSSKEVWWLGECGHEWQTKFFLRAARGASCIYCGNRQVLPGFNDIATKNPQLATKWSGNNAHPVTRVLNGGKASHLWVCDQGHEYGATVAQILKSDACRYCSNRQLLAGFNDLATKFPHLATEWHPTKNGDLTPENVIAGGATSYWWQCSQGHEWKTTIRHRLDGQGCAFCSNQKIMAGFNDLATLSPELSAEWHPTKNGDLTPNQVGNKSSLSVWWLGECGHDWKMKVFQRTAQKSNCQICKKYNEIGDRSLTEKAPRVAAEWHPTKNGSLVPQQVSFGSNQKVWWLGECGHEWEAVVYHRATMKHGCPVCRGLQVQVGVNALSTTHADLVPQWHPTKNGSLTPDNVTAGSNKEVWWLDEHGHEWEQAVHKRAGRNYGCPVCSNHKIISGTNDLATIHPVIAAEWHPTKNGDIKPEVIPSNGGRGKAWWICSVNPAHEWEARIAGRVLVNGGCPQCWATTYISKAEQDVYEFIQSLDSEMKIVQSDKKLLRGKELDIYIPEKKFAVEFNGLFWHSEGAGKGKAYHHDKWLQCKLLGVQLVQVWEDEWVRNPEQVKQMLAHKLGFSSQRKVYARSTEVKLVDTVTAKAFLEKNHIQGFASGSHYLALTEKNDDTVLALLVLRKEPGEENVLNIIRYATAANVVGGFTKLLKHAEKTYSPESFITFADHCVSDGGLYESNGFVADKILSPDYMYVVKNERKHKFGYRLKRFQNDPELLWEPNLTERELAALNGLERIWDAGKTRYRKAVR